MAGLFSGAALAAIVQKTLAEVPADKTMAVVATVDTAGVNVSVAYRVKDRWRIGAAVTRDNTGGLTVGASVLFTM